MAWCSDTFLMDALGQSALLLALTSFALGFSALTRNARNKVVLAYSVVTGVVAIWAFFFFLERVWGGGSFYRIHLLAHVWLAPVALTFVRLMLRVEDASARRLLETSVVASIALTVALIFGLESWGILRALIYFSPVFIFIQTAQLMWFDRRLRLGLRIRPKLPVVGFSRRSWIYFGALAALSLSVMDHVPWMGNVVPAMGNLGLAIYLFFLGQAISHQRLLNFNALLSRLIVMAALAVALASFYSLLVAWVEGSPGLFFLNSVIASFLILMLLDPLKTVTGYFTQRLLTQRDRRISQILRESQRRLTGIVDQGALYSEVLLVVEQAIQPLGAAFYVLRRDGTRFRRVRATGAEADGEKPAPKELIAHHALLDYCATLKRKGDIPVVLDQILENEIDRSATRAREEVLQTLLQGLRALRCNVLIPIFAESEILGFLTLHAPTPPEPWGSNWGLLPAVYPYFEQVGYTLRSMESFVRQREKERLVALGEMAAGLAHEIRNPLGAIKGAAQVLASSGPEAPDPGLLQVITDEAGRLNRVVSQFLEYSKPATAATEFKTADLGLLMEKSVERLRPGLPVDIELSATRGEGELWVLASAEQLQQVILNLVQNSIQAGAKAIQMWTESLGQGSTQEIQLCVEDNGAGITRENLDKLFIPFFTTSPSGTGLGLSICQKIIEAHRGRIEVSSEPGKTRFTVILPAAETKA